MSSCPAKKKKMKKSRVLLACLPKPFMLPMIPTSEKIRSKSLALGYPYSNFNLDYCEVSIKKKI